MRYARLGVSIFQIYGSPFLEEATHIGERFVPLARTRLAAVGDQVVVDAASGDD